MKTTSHQLIFLMGVGRSGTTLLQSMLNAHSSIHFNKETHFVKNYVVKEISKKRYSNQNINDLVQDVKQDPLLVEFQGNIDEAKANVLKAKPSLITPSFFASLLKKNGVFYLGEKDPMNVNYLSEIKQGFPNSKVIHIIRDPRDVILSRLRSKWAKRKSVIWHSVEYGFSIDKVRREGNSFFGKDYVEIKYEELLKDRTYCLKELCNFLEVDFEENMCNPEKTAASLIRSDELQWKSNVLNPVDTGNVGKWKTGLTLTQKEKVNVILKEEIKSLAYEPYSIKMLKISSLFYVLISNVLNELFKFRFN